MPVINIPAQYFSVNTWNGSGTSTADINLGFQPDLVWIKPRNNVASNANSHILIDSVRGVDKVLRSDTTGAEVTESNNVITFTSTGITVGNSHNVNKNTTSQYVVWGWKAGGTAVTNNSGNVTSQVSASAISGFSIVSVAGQNNTSTLTIGHGLGVAPKMLIGKSRNGTGGWSVWHTTLATNELVYLNSTAAKSVDGGTPPAAFTATSLTTFTVQNWNRMIGSGVDGIFYAFAEVAGYSAFGSYTGNGSADGPFVFCGFRPRFVLVKSSTNATNWAIIDTSRSTSNAALLRLRPNSSGAEDSYTTGVDIVSNGFKVRDSTSDWNDSGATYIYAAFAANPFKYSLGA